MPTYLFQRKGNVARNGEATGKQATEALCRQTEEPDATSINLSVLALRRQNADSWYAVGYALIAV